MRLLWGILVILTTVELSAGGVEAAENSAAAGSGTRDTTAAGPDLRDRDPETASTPGHPASSLQPYRATYSTSYNGLPITTTRTFGADANSYRVATEAKNFLGHIREEAVFRDRPDTGLEPLRYLYQRSIIGNKRREETVFDHRRKTITNTYKKETVDLPYGDDALGPLSYQIQMQLDLLAGKREFSYPVVTRGRVKEYRYRVTGEEIIETPMGDIRTLVLERIRDDDERETFLWLAEEFQYLPVKLLQREDDESYEMVIKSYTLTDTE